MGRTAKKELLVPNQVHLSRRQVDFVKSFMAITGNKFAAELRAILDNYIGFFEDKESWKLYMKHNEKRFSKEVRSR